MKGFIPRLGKKRTFKRGKRGNRYHKRRVKRVRSYGNSRGGIRM